MNSIHRSSAQTSRWLHAEQKSPFEEKVKLTFLLDPKPSLVPLCHDVMLATLPNSSSAGSPLIVEQEMKHEAFWKRVLYLGIFFLNLILRHSNFIRFDDITWLTESTEVSQHFACRIPCLDCPLMLFLLYCRCTLKLFRMYWNSCIYKGPMWFNGAWYLKSFVHIVYIYIHI